MDQERQAPLNVVFFGTPPFAARILDDIAGDPDVLVQAVVTQPDRPCGRGRVCKPSAVKETALARGYPVLQPTTLKDAAVHAELDAYRSDFFIVAAYGLIFPEAVLELPRHGCLNVHASLLPRYRGASPIQAALLAGDHVTGITIMRMAKGMDTGPILLQRAMGIDINDTAQTLHDQLGELGGRFLLESLARHRKGTLIAQEQNHALASYAPRLTKDQGLINWNQPARTVHNHIRAMHPWPGAYFYLPGGQQPPRKVAVHPGKVGEPLPEGTHAPGSFIGIQNGMLAIACQDKTYLVEYLHPSHAKRMDALAFRCGYLQQLLPGDNICETLREPTEP
ncbi:methionyl-tRNA formyltransferase [Desulfonatronum thiosulfatophilum]|uniref:Methionyl-tRNA formyltransferase n=1 Tax=Desulfonatronum thiosulfatophilum TaxID=617002 RepID=A0A1G6B7V1_9BACT|nr:methionyl-tRNA formyltransferase [Desulfonatronum thiosulfatophilum]SDB16473.1 methionyl-tRNA formyltransferase [Desulfonatronum thiosulfatophilum]